MFRQSDAIDKTLISKAIAGDLKLLLRDKRQPLDNNIIKVVEKASYQLYGQFLHSKKHKGLSIENIREQVANFVIQKGVANGIIPEHFHYESTRTLDKLEQRSLLFKTLMESPMQHDSVTMSRDLAQSFLPQYTKRIIRLHIEAANLNKYNPASDELLAVQKKIDAYENAIKQINDDSMTEITITFPPVRNFQELVVEMPSELNLILAAQDASPSMKKLQEVIERKIEINASLEKKCIEAANNIHENNYNIKKIESVLDSFDSHAPKMSGGIAQALLNGLYEKIENQSLQLPLSPKTKSLLDAYLSVHQLLSSEKMQESNKAYAKVLKEMDKKIKTGDLLKIYNDNAAVVNHEILNNNNPTKISSNLSEKEEHFLKLYTKIVKEKNPGCDEDRKFLAQMMTESMGNLGLNKKLTNFLKQDNKSYAQYNSAATAIRYFCFKTQHLHLYPQLIAKAQKGLKKIATNNTLDDADKLTIFEYGRLEELAQLRPQLAELGESVIQKSGALSGLYEQSVQALKILEEHKEKLQKDHGYQSGDILLSETKKTLSAKNRDPDRETFLMENFVSKYGHAAHMYVDKWGRPTLSHIGGEYYSSEVKASEIINADIFRLDIKKLIPAPMKAQLIEHFKAKGQDFDEEIVKMYQENVNKLHSPESQAKFEKISNDPKRRYEAGIADYSVFGHKKLKSKSRTDVRDAMYGKGSAKLKDMMICSEFVARSVTAVLVETNEQLTRMLASENAGTTPENIITIPFSNEKLSKIHPQRLMTILKEANCITKVDPPKILQQLVNFDKVNKAPIKGKRREQDSAVEWLLNRMVKIAQKYPDPNEFLPRALKAVRSYALYERVDLNLKDKASKEQLIKSLKILHSDLREVRPAPTSGYKEVAKSFKTLYSDLKKSQPSEYIDKFIKFFKSLIKIIVSPSVSPGVFGEDKAKKTMGNALAQLNHMRVESLKNKYAEAPAEKQDDKKAGTELFKTKRNKVAPEPSPQSKGISKREH